MYAKMHTHETDEDWTRSIAARLLYFMKHICQSAVTFSSLHNLRYESILRKPDYEMKLRDSELKDTADDDIIKKIIPAMKKVIRYFKKQLSVFFCLI